MAVALGAAAAARIATGVATGIGIGIVVVGRAALAAEPLAVAEVAGVAMLAAASRRGPVAAGVVAGVAAASRRDRVADRRIGAGADPSVMHHGAPLVR